MTVSDFVSSEKVLPKKWAFDNRDLKRNTSRSKNFSLFQTYKFLWKRGKFLWLFLLNVQRMISTPLFFGNTMLSDVIKFQSVLNQFLSLVFQIYKFSHEGYELLILLQLLVENLRMFLIQKLHFSLLLS